MLGVFVLALVLWATSQFTKIDATTVAFLGISILAATGVLVWDDRYKLKRCTWGTLVWMGVFINEALRFLVKLGFIKWATVLVGGYIPERILDYCLRYSCTYYTYSTMYSHL